jgi:hypothetical protein
MERIVLEVSDTVAKKWRTSSFRLRSQLNALVAKQIAELLDKSETEDSIRFFDEIRAEMKAKGLTQEELENILHDA